MCLVISTLRRPELPAPVPLPGPQGTPTDMLSVLLHQKTLRNQGMVHLSLAQEMVLKGSNIVMEKKKRNSIHVVSNCDIMLLREGAPLRSAAAVDT